MTDFALVEDNNTVVTLFNGSLPSWIALPNGDQVSGLHTGVITSDGVYSILPAQYDAMPANSQETGRSYAISNGTVQSSEVSQIAGGYRVMDYALVENSNTVIPPLLSNLQGWITLPNGDRVSGLHEGVITSDGVYSIFPVQYDTPPANSQETGRSYAVSNGVVQVTQTWQLLPISVPLTITNAQARCWFYNNNLIAQVQAAAEAAGGTTLLRWEYGNNFERNHPDTIAIIQALGKTDAEADQMFIEASAL